MWNLLLHLCEHPPDPPSLFRVYLHLYLRQHALPLNSGFQEALPLNSGFQEALPLNSGFQEALPLNSGFQEAGYCYYYYYY